MKISHVALWTRNLEEMKEFYVKYFNGQPSQKYLNPKNNSESYFLHFSSESRLELMRKPDVQESYC